MDWLGPVFIVGGIALVIWAFAIHMERTYPAEKAAYSVDWGEAER